MAVDFFDHIGSAVLKVGWQRIGPPASGQPDVDDYSQASATGRRHRRRGTLAGVITGITPAYRVPQPLARYDAAINFDWGF